MRTAPSYTEMLSLGETRWLQVYAYGVKLLGTTNIAWSLSHLPFPKLQFLHTYKMGANNSSNLLQVPGPQPPGSNA